MSRLVSPSRTTVRLTSAPSARARAAAGVRAPRPPSPTPGTRPTNGVRRGQLAPCEKEAALGVDRAWNRQTPARASASSGSATSGCRSRSSSPRRATTWSRSTWTPRRSRRSPTSPQLHRGHPVRAPGGASATACAPTTRYADLAEVDAVIIAVPTPLTENREPDLQPLISAGAALARRAPARASSSCSSRRPTRAPRATGSRRCSRSPACTPARRSTSRSRPSASIRAAPTTRSARRRRSSAGSRRAASSAPSRSTATVCDEVVPVSTPEVAELTKLLENIFRSVNIALVNEIAMLCDRMEHRRLGGRRRGGHQALRVHVVQARARAWAATACRSTRSTSSWKAREFDSQDRVHRAGRRGQRGDAVLLRREDRPGAQRRRASRSAARAIAILGVSYKAGVGDVRESPAIKIMRLLAERGAELAYHDPYVPELPASAWPRSRWTRCSTPTSSRSSRSTPSSTSTAWSPRRASSPTSAASPAAAPRAASSASSRASLRRRRRPTAASPSAARSCASTRAPRPITLVSSRVPTCSSCGAVEHDRVLDLRALDRDVGADRACTGRRRRARAARPGPMIAGPRTSVCSSRAVGCDHAPGPGTRRSGCAARVDVARAASSSMRRLPSSSASWSPWQGRQPSISLHAHLAAVAADAGERVAAAAAAGASSSDSARG